MKTTILYLAAILVIPVLIWFGVSTLKTQELESRGLFLSECLEDGIREKICDRIFYAKQRGRK